MFGTDSVTGLFGKIKQQLIPTFVAAPTQQNPRFNRGTMPRLRHYKKKGAIRLRLPANMYSQKEAAKQQASISNYHQRQRFQHRQRELANETRKLNRHIAIAERKELKANKPVFE